MDHGQVENLSHCFFRPHNKLLMKELLAKNYSQELENNFKHKINRTE